MRYGWFLTFRSSFLSLLLHLVVIGLLIISFTNTPEPKVKPKHINIVDAVTVDKKQVDAELNRIKKAEQEKLDKQKQELEKLRKQTEAEKEKVRAAEKKRQQEEQELKLAQTKKEQEKKKKEQELKELERQRQIEEERKKKAEAERLKAEEEAEKKRKEAEEAEKKRQAEEEKRKQVAAEKARKEQEEKLRQELLAAEERELQQQADARLINKIAADIQDKVTGYFNKAGLPENLKCKLRVKLLPGGNVIDVTIDSSSGNDIFDRRAVNAVQKASPLPVPSELETFERLDLRDITFTFTP